MSSSKQRNEQKQQSQFEGLNAYGINSENLMMLEDFINLVKNDSAILNHSRLAFFKNWLVNE